MLFKQESPLLCKHLTNHSELLYITADNVSWSMTVLGFVADTLWNHAMGKGWLRNALTNWMVIFCASRALELEIPSAEMIFALIMAKQAF